MASIDLEALLQPISDDAPSGDDMEYDPAFAEMERAAQGKAEQQVGDSVIEAEEPDWREVSKLAIGLLEKTRDLRVVVHLARAQLKMNGFAGAGECFSLLKGYVVDLWPSVHPQLDEDDDNDPTFRINTLSGLCDQSTWLTDLQLAPLVSSKMVGRFSLRDLAIAKGDLAAPEGEENLPDLGVIEAAFMDTEIDDLKATSEVVDQAVSDIEAIEDCVTDQVGAAQAISFGPLQALLKQAQETLHEKLAARGVSEESDEADDTDAESGAESSEETGGKPAVVVPPDRLSGKITTREDVLRALDMVCEYYERYEPSSPLPLLINRAKRLATKNFLDIIRDLTPEALAQAAALGGVNDSSGNDEAE